MKYISDKIEQMKGSPFLRKIIFIASEANSDITSETMCEFEDLPHKEICKILNWKQEQFVYDKIEATIKESDDSLAKLMARAGFYGFLAEVHHPLCNRFSGETLEKYGSYSVHYGITQTQWISGNDFGELLHNFEEAAQEIFEGMFENDRAERINQISK